MNLKEIHIGQIIEKGIEERGIELSRICNFLKCSEEEINEMYKQKNLDTDMLLRWSKLQEYDFFRIYSQHLILYAPPVNQKEQINSKATLPQFRKNIYTKEIIDFILEQIDSEELTINEIMLRYKIPRTTIYKWIRKYKK